MATHILRSDPEYFKKVSSPGRTSGEFLRHFGNDGGSRVIGPDPTDTKAPVVMMLWMQPGGRIPKHAHKNHRFEIIIQGTRILEDGTVMHPGDIEITGEGEFYGPSIAGPEGTLSAEVIMTAEGAGYILPADISPEDLKTVTEAAEVLARLRGEAVPVVTVDRT
jgi:hypothetical protein